MKPLRRGRKGQALIEFTLVGIPVIFLLICIFEMARAMWVYDTMAYALKEGTRFAVVHGQNCDTPPNTCQVTVATIARVIRRAGVGLLPDDLTLTIQNGAGTTVYPTATRGPRTLALHLADLDLTPWPPKPGSAPGNEIIIFGKYRFRSVLVFFWPGAGPASVLGTIYLPATSREQIYF